MKSAANKINSIVPKFDKEVVGRGVIAQAVDALPGAESDTWTVGDMSDVPTVVLARLFNAAQA